MAQTTRTRASICLLVVSSILLPILGMKSPPPKKIQVWGVNGRFQAKLAKIVKVSYYRNCCIDSNHILHNDRHHQVVIVGGPNTRPTNPRLQPAAILKTVKSSYICNRLTSFDETSAYGARPVLVSRASRSARELRRRRVLCRSAIGLSAEKSCLPARPWLPAGVRALGA